MGASNALRKAFNGFVFVIGAITTFILGYFVNRGRIPRADNANTELRETVGTAREDVRKAASNNKSARDDLGRAREILENAKNRSNIQHD
jgi:hypothetical protein